MVHLLLAGGTTLYILPSHPSYFFPPTSLSLTHTPSTRHYSSITTWSFFFFPCCIVFRFVLLLFFHPYMYERITLVQKSVYVSRSRSSPAPHALTTLHESIHLFCPRNLASPLYLYLSHTHSRFHIFFPPPLKSMNTPNPTHSHSVSQFSHVLPP